MLKQQNSVFIDPENCGSSVGYYITGIVNAYAEQNGKCMATVYVAVLLKAVTAFKERL